MAFKRPYCLLIVCPVHAHTVRKHCAPHHPRHPRLHHRLHLPYQRPCHLIELLCHSLTQPPDLTPDTIPLHGRHVPYSRLPQQGRASPRVGLGPEPAPNDHRWVCMYVRVCVCRCVCLASPRVGLGSEPAPNDHRSRSPLSYAIHKLYIARARTHTHLRSQVTHERMHAPTRARAHTHTHATRAMHRTFTIR